MPTYAYSRVSTVRQAEEGESLGAQERTLAVYAMMHGLAIDRCFIERGVSGAKPLSDRPEGAALLAARFRQNSRRLQGQLCFIALLMTKPSR